MYVPGFRYFDKSKRGNYWCPLSYGRKAIIYSRLGAYMCTYWWGAVLDEESAPIIQTCVGWYSPAVAADELRTIDSTNNSNR